MCITCVTRVNAAAKLLHISKLCTINVLFCFYALTVCNTRLSITHQMACKIVHSQQNNYSEHDPVHAATEVCEKNIKRINKANK